MSWQRYVFVVFALAFDRLAKSLACNLNAYSSNCISEVSCSLSSWSLLFKFVTNLFKPWEILTHEWEWSLLKDSILISTLYLPYRQQVVTSNTGSNLGVPSDPTFLVQIYFHLLARCTHDRPLNLWSVREFFTVFRHEILSDFNCGQESCMSTKFGHSVLLW